MMLTAIRYLSAFVLLISLFPNSVALAEADHLSPSAVPLREKADTEIFHKDFSGHLAEFRPLAQRKDAVEKEYVRLAQIMRDVQLEQAKVDAEIKGLQSRGINHENANHALRVAVERDLLVLSRTSAKAMLDFLVEEYDILSRLEGLDVMRKANAIHCFGVFIGKPQLAGSTVPSSIISTIGKAEYESKRQAARASDGTHRYSLISELIL